MLAYILGISKQGNEGITNYGLQIGTRGIANRQIGQLKGFQIGEKRLQIEAGVSNWGKKISN